MEYKKIFTLSILITGFLFSFKIENLSCNIVPKNNIQISESSKDGITEKEFNDVLDEFERVMSPIVKKSGYKLEVVRKWKDGTVNANTTVSGNKWVINAFGGLARYKGVDADAFMMVMCHELGHHLGGYPAQGWASNEGQSDYYATAKCYPRMSYSKIKALKSPEIVKEKCSIQHKSQEEIDICEKGSMIGYSLASVLNSLSGSPKPLDFTTPDKSEVSRTDNSHPAAQCRLDTYFAGAVCGMPYTEEFSKDSPVPGACAEEKGDKLGVRPRCWYKPR